uniref:Acyl carrier protein n=1 Tax=Streptomyces sp. R1128 TaxID=140437 RepID=Q9F6D5_9ACTN|nr:acyl carrier protein [Streptomyces sp. R1128]
MDPFTLDDLKRLIDACVGTDDAVQLDETGAATPFLDLGLDSLAVYEVVTRIQDERGVAISDDDIDGLETPRDMVAFVNGLLVETAG